MPVPFPVPRLNIGLFNKLSAVPRHVLQPVPGNHYEETHDFGLFDACLVPTWLVSQVIQVYPAYVIGCIQDGQGNFMYRVHYPGYPFRTDQWINAHYCFHHQSMAIIWINRMLQNPDADIRAVLQRAYDLGPNAQPGPVAVPPPLPQDEIMDVADEIGDVEIPDEDLQPAGPGGFARMPAEDVEDLAPMPTPKEVRGYYNGEMLFQREVFYAAQNLAMVRMAKARTLCNNTFATAVAESYDILLNFATDQKFFVNEQSYFIKAEAFRPGCLRAVYCPFCVDVTQSFTGSESFHRHYLERHSLFNRFYLCPVPGCNYRTYYSNHLRRHVNVHGEDDARDAHERIGRARLDFRGFFRVTTAVTQDSSDVNVFGNIRKSDYVVFKQGRISERQHLQIPRLVRGPILITADRHVAPNQGVEIVPVNFEGQNHIKDEDVIVNWPQPDAVPPPRPRRTRRGGRRRRSPSPPGNDDDDSDGSPRPRRRRRDSGGNEDVDEDRQPVLVVERRRQAPAPVPEPEPIAPEPIRRGRGGPNAGRRAVGRRGRGRAAHRGAGNRRDRSRSRS